MDIKVRFGFGRSASFTKALEICAGLHGFWEYYDSDALVFELSFSVKKLAQVMPALKHIGKLKSKRILISGVEAAWKQTLDFLPCFEKY